MVINSIRGQYVKKGSLEPVGVCDRSGFWFSKSDLVKEYVWRGDELVWNGLIVGKPFLDKPNEQMRTPKVFEDPKPVEDPRPAYYEPEGIDAPAEELRANLLTHNANFKSEPGISPNIHNIMGPDATTIKFEEREKELNNINFNSD